ncbi:MAG: peptide chain release factor 3 [Acidimicrobiales bacterium]|nr:peptide chain release factor 3 [Acidimicrobiales bacterium]
MNEVTNREVLMQSKRRRTFAIISHPDAGKTTLTEKLLLYAGAVSEAGAVKARGSRRRATSDWMAMEQERGISITSTALQFTYKDHVINLLDTPGHRDFSEDTYRVLSAADSAVMVLDTAKGIEAQTLKLFQVCRSRNMPIITFLNKFDRPGKEPIELLDEIEKEIGLIPAPLTWPVGIPGDFKGVVDRRDGNFIRYSRTARGATEAKEEILDPQRASIEEGKYFEQAMEECDLLNGTGANYDSDLFLSGIQTPVFVGSALTNFGVRMLLEAVIELSPSPSARPDYQEVPRPLASPFSGFVFKVQANMDPSHRDHIAFVRVCSGKFERGMNLVHQPSLKPFRTKYAASVFGSERDTIDEAYPGDVIGLVNASDLQIGDTLFEKDEVKYPPIASFAPELFAKVRAKDTGRYKQFKKVIVQLEREGTIQLLYDLKAEGDPIAAAVGEMQFEVLAHRMQAEFGAEIEMTRTPHKLARVTDIDTANLLAGVGGNKVMRRNDGTYLALFESPYWLQRIQGDHPDWKLDTIVAGTTQT